MLARSLRWVLGIWLLAPALWWWLVDSPEQAAFLALSWLLLPLVVVLMLFVLQWLIQSQSDVRLRASVPEVLIAWWQELRASAWAFLWAQPLHAQRLPDADHVSPMRGVVLIHGFVCNRGLWLPWMRQLQAQGRPYLALNLEPVFASIDDYADQIDEAVERLHQLTGQPPVLICHSMGGLAARAWLRRRRTVADQSTGFSVHKVITLGTPHAGTWLAKLGFAPNAAQMRLGSRWLEQLQEEEPAELAQRFECWYSNTDNIVFPASTAALHGARNHLVKGLGHMRLALDAEIQRRILSRLD